MTKVTIYTTPACAYCKATKEFFKENKINYQEVDVSVDRQAAQMIVEKSGQMSVPITIIEKNGKEEIVVGFDRPKFSEILGIK